MNNFIKRILLFAIVTISGIVYAGDGEGTFDPPTSPIDTYVSLAAVIAVMLIIAFRKKIQSSFK